MSAIYENAVDSLRIGFEFFRRERNYSSRKHAILTVFHSIELFLKEHLFRTNPVLIYQNIDARITDDSLTVGIRDILIRFENIGLKLPKEQTSAIERIQKIRNRIEHHRCDPTIKEGETSVVTTEPRNWRINRRSKSSLRAPLFDSPPDPPCSEPQSANNMLINIAESTSWPHKILFKTRERDKAF